jgi:hypothetical protein
MVDVYQKCVTRVPRDYTTHASPVATIEANDQIVRPSGLLDDLVAAWKPGVNFGNRILASQSPILA